MQSDEQLYELSAKELAESPRQGLLIKCMANSDGDENRGKALYIKTRVEEMKREIREGLKKEKQEAKFKKYSEKEKSFKATKPSTAFWYWFIFIGVSIAWILYVNRK